MKKKIFYFVFLLSTLMISSCGKTSNFSDIPATNSPVLSAAQFEEQRAKLHEKYDIPLTVQSLSLEDYQKKWDSLKPQIRTASGTQTVYPDLNTMSKLSQETVSEYPDFDEESYIKSSYEGNPSITQEEIEKKLSKKIDALKSEIRYIVFKKMTSSETKERIISNAIKAQSIKSQGYAYIGPEMYSEEFWFLVWRPWLWEPAAKAKQDATSETITRFGQNESGDKSDAFRHAFSNILFAKYSEINCNKQDALWNATMLLTAHEDGGRRTGDNVPYDTEMDLHNNVIGRKIYDSNSWNVTHSWGWGWFTVRYERGSSISFGDFSNKVMEAINQSEHFSSSDYNSIKTDNKYNGKLVYYR